MGSESIAHEAEGRVGYRLKGHESERNNCLSKFQLVGQKIYIYIETKHLLQVKSRLQSFFAIKTLEIWRELFATCWL